MSSADKIQPLSLSTDALATYQDWVAWRRSVLFYIEYKDIQDPSRRKAVLLHQGGRPLQEIFATLEAADAPALTKEVQAARDKNPFEYALQLLDKHFKPSTNKFYERFLFRRIRQNDDSIDQFVVRLRKQVVNCSYTDVPDALIDQIIEGTSNHEFQKKILEQRLQSLHKIIELGKLLETVKVQSSAFSSGKSPLEEDVARLQVSRPLRPADEKAVAPTNQRRCNRCGSFAHTGQDTNCPARESICFKCDRVGHFATRCRTRPQQTPQQGEKQAVASSSKTPAQQSAEKPTPKVRTLGVASADSSSDEDRNCFQLTTKVNKASFSNKVLLRFGPLTVSPVVDSGADRNLLSYRLWRELCAAGLSYEPAQVDARVYAYGSKTPISFERAVRFEVASKSVSVPATFFVVAARETECETIVGRILGVQLGILSIGDDVAAVRQLGATSAELVKLGKLTDVALVIPLDPDVKPVAQPCRRVPFPLREKIRAHVAELLREDIIEQVGEQPTPWVSPIVPVIKKNGSLRLCIDMRQANRAVLRQKFPIPTFEELLAEMADCQTFSKIDLRSAYNQVELAPESREITTFVTPDGIFRFKRLYCGIRCAPEMFQSLMASVIAGLPNVRVFFDDIIIFSKSKSEHDGHVKALLDRLKQRGLSINLEKSKFAVPEVEFLGHRLTKNKIRPNMSNAEAINAFHAPENKKDLQSFLGLMNYVSRFIPDYSSLTAPLRHLLGKDVRFRWSVEHAEAFEKLKQAINNVELSIYDPNATILLFADASPVALGAVLMQRKATSDVPEILAFASRSLSKPEQNYAQIEREALGIVWACERFRLYTLGKRFELFTDHRPLEVLFGPRSKPNARIERWVLRLQSFDYDIRYIQGPKNLADPFSRLGHSEPSKRSYTPHLRVAVRMLATLAVPAAITLDEFRAESRADDEITSTIQALRDGTKLPDAFLKVRFELTFVDDLLLRGDRLVPPKSLRSKILSQAHEGHAGAEVMKRRLRSKVWWPKVDLEADKFVKSCLSCIAVSRLEPPEPMRRSELPRGPWEYVAVDHLGPLPNGKHLLVVVDYFSRFLEFQFVSSTSSTETIEHLSQMFARFGFPSRLKSDNGTAFSSKEFRDFMNEYAVDHITSPPLWPRANGEVERQNRSLLKRLKIAAMEHKNLRIEMAKYVLLYHSTPHSTTGVSPSELMFQRKIRDKLPSLSHPSPLHADIKDADAESKAAGKAYADQRKGLTGAPREISVGDSVLLPAQKSNKLSPTFDPSPYTVVAARPGEVTVQRGSQTLRRSSSAVKPIPSSAIAEIDVRPEQHSPAPRAITNAVEPSDDDLEEPPFRGFPDQGQSESGSAPIVTRSGRVVKCPSRFSFST